MKELPSTFEQEPSIELDTFRNFKELPFKPLKEIKMRTEPDGLKDYCDEGWSGLVNHKGNIYEGAAWRCSSEKLRKFIQDHGLENTLASIFKAQLLVKTSKNHIPVFTVGLGIGNTEGPYDGNLGSHIYRGPSQPSQPDLSESLKGETGAFYEGLLDYIEAYLKQTGLNAVHDVWREEPRPSFRRDPSKKPMTQANWDKIFAPILIARGYRATEDSSGIIRWEKEYLTHTNP